MLTLTTTSNITIEGELTLTEEQQAEMAKYWENLWQRELMRQLMGQPSEYAESLRASKAKI